MAEIIRNPIKYLAEMFLNTEWDPRLAIADSVYSRQYNIYAFSIADRITDTSNYWIAWGGNFDNPTITSLQLFMDQFLVQVYLPSVLIVTENCYYIDTVNRIVYMNLPKNPWRYFSEYASLYGNTESSFSTAPKNEKNLSDIKYGTTKVDPRMDIPTLENELNDVICGITVYGSFSIKIDNSDGKYDGLDILSYFNTPLRISKSIDNPEDISDFNIVRYGLIQDITVEYDYLQITAEDQLYLMETDFCPKFTTDEFLNLDDSDVNDDIPIGWGTLYGIEPIEVDKDTADTPTWIDYIALDKDYITSVQGVYDKDGNSLTYSFDSSTGIIRVTSVDDDGEVIEAEYMNVTGKTDCNIGEIIIFALEENENLPYIEGIWDITETDAYIAMAPDVGFYFDGGTTKDLIEAVLANDIAFLIQKNDGRLTIRRWGETYETHQIPSWIQTETPKKNFEDASKYFCSSVKIYYKPHHSEDYYQNNYLDENSERDIFKTYRKSYLAEFETDLLTEADAADLAGRLMERFGEMRETVEVSLGVDTFDINLLDTIIMDVESGNPARTFSQYSKWIVKKADPGQDTLTMEGIEIWQTLTLDGSIASLDGDTWAVSKEIS